MSEPAALTRLRQFHRDLALLVADSARREPESTRDYQTRRQQLLAESSAAQQALQKSLAGEQEALTAEARQSRHGLEQRFQADQMQAEKPYTEARSALVEQLAECPAAANEIRRKPLDHQLRTRRQHHRGRRHRLARRPSPCRQADRRNAGPGTRGGQPLRGLASVAQRLSQAGRSRGSAGATAKRKRLPGRRSAATRQAERPESAGPASRETP